MNANVTVTEVPRPTRTTVRVGLVLAALLGLVDVIGGISQLGPDALLPFAVAATTIVLGLITIVVVPFAWPGAGWASWTVIVTRAVAAMTALPAFFVPGVPVPAVIAAAVTISVTVLAIVLILMRGRAPLPSAEQRAAAQ
jgi:hypothetical protein